MRVCITTVNRKVGDYVFDLLTNPLSGHDCLCGSKFCIDDHNMVPDIMEFDLNENEIEEVRKIEGVVDVRRSDLGEVKLSTVRPIYKVRTPDVIFRNASYTYADNISTTARPRISPSGQAPNGLNLGPAYQYYATTHQPSATQLVPETNNRMTSAFSLDCREVDIIIFDTGVDPSCEDLKNIFGEPLVQIFDWAQVVDPFEPFLYYATDLSKPDQLTQIPNYIAYQDYNNDPNSNGWDNANDLTYNNNLSQQPVPGIGWVNGSNGGTGGFQPWAITSPAGTSAFIGSSIVNAFGNIDANGESFGLSTNATSRISVSRPFRQNLPVGYEFSVQLATNLRDGDKGINVFNSSNVAIVNFKAVNNTFRLNNQVLDAAVDKIGQSSSTAIWNLRVTQKTSTNVEVTLFRTDLATVPLTSINVTVTDATLNRVEFYNQNGTGAGNNLYFNNLRLQRGYEVAVPSVANYYVDHVGHGTECASIAAGLKCGMAKNARIFALNATDLGAPFGYSFDKCLKLAAGFLLGKKNAWYGLNPTTPTILSCSFGVDGPMLVGIGIQNITNLNTTTGNVSWSTQVFGPLGTPQGKSQPISGMGTSPNTPLQAVEANNNDNLLATSFNQGGVNILPNFLTSVPVANAPNLSNGMANAIPSLPMGNPTVDGYMRTLVLNGMHVVVAAGNSNLELNQRNPDLLPVLFFRNDTVGSPARGQTFSVLRQMVLNSSTQKYTDNGAGLALGQSYNVAADPNNPIPTTQTWTLFASGNTYRNYQSPDVGVEAESIVIRQNDPIQPSTFPLYNRENYPLIKVGCVSALGDNDNAASSYDSGGYTRSIYNLLYSERKPFLMKSNAPGTGGMIDAASIFIRQSGASSFFTNRIATRLTGHWNPFAYTPFTGTAQPAATLSAPHVGILYNDGVNNRNLSYRAATDPTNGTMWLQDPVYVKSPYSNFGPAVDVYAVGNATWAGLSNQMLDPAATAAANPPGSQSYTPIYYSQTGKISANDAAPYFREGLNRSYQSLNNNLTQHGGLYRGKYKFANGTSAATPAVAGMLATFLAQYPRATPLEAKRWLESSSIKGKILTTVRTPLVSSISGYNATSPNVPGGFGITFGPDPRFNFNTGTVARASAVSFGSLGYNHNLYTGFPSTNTGPTYLSNTIPQINNQSALPTWPFCISGLIENNGLTHLMPTHYFRNTNYFWTSAYFDRYFSTDTGPGQGNFNGTIVPNFATIGTTVLDVLFPKYFNYLQNFLFQCRFFSDSNNRVAQAHPLRSAVLRGATGTAYASSVYVNQFGATTLGTRLNIWSTPNTINETTTHLRNPPTVEYRIGNINRSVEFPPTTNNGTPIGP